IHSAADFDDTLKAAKDKLVVVEWAASKNEESKQIYPFLVELSRTCYDVIFLLVLEDESEKTREIFVREKIEELPHFSFYKGMEKIHEEEAIGPDQLMGDVLYYGDSHDTVAQLHCREDVVYPAVLKLSWSMADTVTFARMNGDENESYMAFLKDMDVIEVPTFLFIRDGEIKGRYVGSAKGELIGEILRYQGVRVTY
ncbi:unnamed protein product, partial [Linum tenue]